MSKKPEENNEAPISEITFRLVLGNALTVEEMAAFDDRAAGAGKTRDQLMLDLIREQISGKAA